MGLSKIFPCCTQPPGEKEPDERPAKLTEATGASNNAATADLPPKSPAISNLPSNPPNEAEPPKQEVATDISISRRVWNRAYNELAEDEGTRSLVEDYMIAVQKANKPDEDVSESELKESVAKMNDEAERQNVMKQTLEAGRKKIYKSSKVTRGVGAASGFVLKFKSVIDLAVGTNPQAALPWAGVCIGLQFLLNPALESEANESGLGYVISRMEWYCELTEHMLSEKNIVIGDESYEKVRERLETTVVELYKALLLYQMKSACSYAQNQGWTFLRNIISLDDWKGQLDSVKAAEAVVEKDSTKYNEERTQSHLGEIVRNCQGTFSVLTGVQETLQEYIASQSRMARGKDFDECLADLYVEDPQAQLSGIQGLKDDLIPEACEWILKSDEFKSFTDWSDVSQNSSIIKKLFNQSRDAPGISFYFFDASQKTKNSAMDGLRSLIWLLLVQQPHLISYLVEKHKRSKKAMFEGQSAFWFLSETFKAMLADEKLSPVYLAFDALDECAQGTPCEKDLLKIVEDTVKASGKGPTKVKWLLSSRPEVGVYNALHRAKEGAVTDLDVTVHKEPLRAYITHKTTQLRIEQKYEQSTLDDMLAELNKNEQTTFLWVSLVFKDLVSGETGEWEAVEHVSKFPEDLNETYDRIMERINRIKSEREREFCKKVLEAACFASRPLSFDEVHAIAGLPPKLQAPKIVTRCGSFLTVHNDVVYLFHHSTGEYLTRYFESNSPGGPPKAHEALAKQAILAMSKGLRYNMYELKPETESKSFIPPPGAKPLGAIQYSCEFWVHHLLQGTSPIADDSPVLSFLETHFLHWLESLSLLSKLPSALTAIRELLKRTKSTQNKSPKLIAFLQDAERFVMGSLSIMTNVPLQIYGGPLVFSPAKSIIKNRFWEQRTPVVRNISGIDDNWGPCLQTVDGADGQIVFAPNNKLFAIAFREGENDEIVQVWDPSIGVCIQSFVLPVEWKLVAAGFELDAVKTQLFIAFAPDSETIIASNNQTVRLLDVATGDCRDTITVNLIVENMALSPDGKYAAFVAECSMFKSNIRVFTTSNWKHQHTLEEDGEYLIRCMNFASDSKTLASGTNKGRVTMWNVVDGTRKGAVEIGGPGRMFLHQVFLPPNSDHIVTLASEAGKIGNGAVWEVATGECVQKLGADTGADDIALSPDGKLAALCHGMSIDIVNVVDDSFIKRLFPGVATGYMRFSEDSVLLITTGQGVLRFWDATEPKEELPTQMLDHSVLKFSPNGQVLAIGCKDGTIKLQDMTTKETKHTDKERSHRDGEVWRIVFSPDGKMFATIAHDGTVRVWDAVAGDHKGRIEPPIEQDPTDSKSRSNIYDVKFSVDSSCLAIISARHFEYYSRRLDVWSFNEGTFLQDFQKFGDGGIRDFSFSPDGKTVATIAPAKVWDLATRECTHTFEAPKPRRGYDEFKLVAVSRDGKYVAFASMLDPRDTYMQAYVPEIPRLWLWSTEKNDHIVRTMDSEVTELSFSEDGNSLQTNQGVFRLNGGTLGSPDRSLSGSNLYFDGRWVARRGKRLLWMPPDCKLQSADQNHISLVVKGIRDELIQVGFNPDDN
ncbi:NACHT domain protein [Aspergillus sclerotialis]|uniref:NACHT domain protein n=1 Tax=Aspergillus sclerotialis TaxID=2070753 RepID=A0A3A2Z8Q6_9EURO|nr:NACHT domain protein [Aspergillus sclerotialis]